MDRIQTGVAYLGSVPEFIAARVNPVQNVRMGGMYSVQPTRIAWYIRVRVRVILFGTTKERAETVQRQLPFWRQEEEGIYKIKPLLFWYIFEGMK